MSVLETLLAAATSKAGAAVAGLTVAVGAAGAAGQLPDLPSAFDNAFGGPTAEEQVVEDPELQEPLDDGTDETTELEGSLADVTTDDEVAADTDDRGVAHDVHDALNGDEDVMPGDEGFGRAVADNAREGGSEFGQSVADAASNGRSSAGAENAAQHRQDDEQTTDGEAGDADAAGDRSGDGADNAEVADEYRPENPPEDAGPPDHAGPPDDTGKPDDTGRPDGLPEQSNPGQDTAADAPGR